jgi:hypothetical protein
MELNSRAAYISGSEFPRIIALNMVSVDLDGRWDRI